VDDEPWLILILGIMAWLAAMALRRPGPPPEDDEDEEEEQQQQ
jgi:hypothetical protein